MIKTIFCDWLQWHSWIVTEKFGVDTYEFYKVCNVCGKRVELGKKIDKK